MRISDKRLLSDKLEPIDDGKGFVMTLGIETVSEKNQRGSWKKSYYGRTRPNRQHAGLLTLAAKNLLETFGDNRHGVRYAIELTRVAPRALDGDNLRMALSAVRDGVADGLGFCDDRESERLTWSYSQRTDEPRTYGVVVKVVLKYQEFNS